MQAEGLVPTPETTYREYVERGNFQMGVHHELTSTCEYAYIEWREHGNLHRDGDFPSLVYENGFRAWCKNGSYHRDGDLPAKVWGGGHQEWYKDGKMHRDGGLPSSVNPNGSLHWYINGVFVGNTNKPPEGAVFPGQLTKAAR